MKNIYKDYLFNKHILVSERSEQYVFETLFAMANLFGVRITEGQKLATSDMIGYLSEKFGVDVPKPFYRGFPNSVKELTPDQLLFDQLVHYAVTYGYGYFDVPGHSLFETDLGRSVFKENTEIKDFVILSGKDAMRVIAESIEALLAGSRPLNNTEFLLIVEYIEDYGYIPENVASKNTAVKLLVNTGKLEFSRFLQLSDVIKVLDELQYERYGSENLKKLNLKNRDRKLITSLINTLFERGNCNVRECYEKKAVWNGLLHHIHYKPVNEMAQFFLNIIRGRRNYSDYSEFEKALENYDFKTATDIIKTRKGNGALLRHTIQLLRYVETEEDRDYILNSLEPGNFIILLQIYLKYASKLNPTEYMSYSFIKHGTMRFHFEEEGGYKGGFVFWGSFKQITDRFRSLMKETLKNRLGKVYIDPDMKKCALPLASAANSSGFGVMATGSRIKLEETKKLRAFIYWEKVNDIDLSVQGISDKNEISEFSWRTMYDNQSEAITFSGDETSGFNGGSEYFDIVPEAVRTRYPNYRYMVFCANVYSFRDTFADCICRAGYMKRDIEDSGEIFEPKTVETSFKIDCDSNFGYLFAYDLLNNEIIWLNLAQGVNKIVAANGKAEFILKYMEMTDLYNLYDFFEMTATEVTDDIGSADVIVSDRITKTEAGEGKTIIRSYDFDKIKALMN